MQYNCVLNLEKMSQKRMECFTLFFDHFALIEHQFLIGIRDSRNNNILNFQESSTILDTIRKKSGNLSYAPPTNCR